MADDVTSFEDLRARVVKSVALLVSVPRPAIDHTEAFSMLLETPNRTFTLVACDCALTFKLPIFYFHVTTAYSLFRTNGVPL